MNYLAHAYLSFEDADFLAGNMISDFVKGKKKDDYPTGIRNGITLHRAIDTFTDEHPATQAAKTFFRPVYRLYSGAFVDIVYDHFLANDKSIFNESRLKDFSARTYEKLESQLALFPEKFQRLFPYMKMQDWLYHYRYEKGIENSFGGLVRRAKYLNESDEAFSIFKTHYTSLQECYEVFFPQLESHSRTFFDRLKRTST